MIQVTWCASNYNSQVISLLICLFQFWTCLATWIFCLLLKKWMRKAKQLQNIQPDTRCQRGGRVAQWWMTSRSIVFFLAEIRDRVQFILPWLLARQIARQNLWVEVIQPPRRVKRPLLLPLQDWPPPSVPFKSLWCFFLSFQYELQLLLHHFLCWTQYGMVYLGPKHSTVIQAETNSSVCIPCKWQFLVQNSPLHCVSFPLILYFSWHWTCLAVVWAFQACAPALTLVKPLFHLMGVNGEENCLLRGENP